LLYNVNSSIMPLTCNLPLHRPLLQLINFDRVQCTSVCNLNFTFLSWRHLANVLVSLIGWSLEAGVVLDMLPSNTVHFCFLSGKGDPSVVR